MTRSSAFGASVPIQSLWQYFWLITASLLVVTGFSSGCTTNHSSPGARTITPYLPDEELTAPRSPPTFRVAAPGQTLLQPFYLDWSDAGGSAKAPPTEMHWPKLAQGSATLGWLETSQVPIRVVVYLYPQVSSTGVPIERLGSEYRCTQAGSPQALCTYRQVMHSKRAAIEIAVRDRSDTDACYVVVHAGWIVRYPQAARGKTAIPDTDTSEVGASWAWHRCAT
jgi:hypothetical protein